jgi:antitoxin VapB
VAFHVRDPETDALVRRLARRKGCGLTEAVKLAVNAELHRESEQLPMMERIRELQRDVARYPDSGLKADKAFYDRLSGED